MRPDRLATNVTLNKELVKEPDKNQGHPNFSSETQFQNAFHSYTILKLKKQQFHQVVFR